jgi:hypothetical protein
LSLATACDMDTGNHRARLPGTGRTDQGWRTARCGSASASRPGSVR